MSREPLCSPTPWPTVWTTCASLFARRCRRRPSRKKNPRSRKPEARVGEATGAEGLFPGAFLLFVRLAFGPVPVLLGLPGHFLHLRLVGLHLVGREDLRERRVAVAHDGLHRRLHLRLVSARRFLRIRHLLVRVLHDRLELGLLLRG